MYVSLGVPPRRLGQLSPAAYAALDPQSQKILRKIAAAMKAVTAPKPLGHLSRLGQAGGPNRLLSIPFQSVFGPWASLTPNNNPSWSVVGLAPSNIMQQYMTGGFFKLVSPPAPGPAGWAPSIESAAALAFYAGGYQVQQQNYSVGPVLWSCSYGGCRPRVKLPRLLPGMLPVPDSMQWNFDKDNTSYYPGDGGRTTVSFVQGQGWNLSPPPPAGAPAQVQQLYQMLTMDNVLLYPTSDELATLGLIRHAGGGLGRVFGIASLASRANYIFTDPDGRWAGLQGALNDTVGNKLWLLQNMKTFMDAIDNYPWPGGSQEVRAFYYTAFRERDSGIIPLVMRQSPPPTPEEFRTAITIVLLSNWADVTTRVAGLAHQEAMREAREAQNFKLTIAVFSLFAGAVVGGVIIPAVISAASQTLTTIETIKLKNNIQDLANAMQSDSPDFATEVNRVNDLIAQPPDGTAAAAPTAAAPAGRVELLQAPTSHVGLYIGMAVAGVAVVGGVLFLVLRGRRK